MTSLKSLLPVLAISLLWADASRAASIHIDSQTEYGDAVFDFTAGGVASFVHGVNVEADTPLGVLPLEFLFYGESGPLESWSADGDDLEFSYEAGGHLFFELGFTLPDGEIHEMVFDGPLGAFSGSAGGPFGQIDQSLSIDVKLDRRSAKLFGMKRHATFELTWLLMDDMDDPGEPWRPGRTYGDFTLYSDNRHVERATTRNTRQLTAVPEPALLTLLPVGLAFALRRRRR
jgi:hypothetical protein